MQPPSPCSLQSMQLNPVFTQKGKQSHKKKHAYFVAILSTLPFIHKTLSTEKNSVEQLWQALHYMSQVFTTLTGMETTFKISRTPK